MLELFHKPELESELKEKLLEELNSENDKSNTPDLDKTFYRLWNKIEENKVKSERNAKTLTISLMIAAVLVVGLVAGFYIQFICSSNESVCISAHSPRGSVSEIMLPDSSIVFLNSNSTLKYSKEESNGVRDVILEGEALFHVKKDEKNEFIVHTPHYNINVTGTQFNVKSYEVDDFVTITLVEGEVNINPALNMTFSEDITLKPGEQAVYNKRSKNIDINKVDTKWYTSWKDNKLIFVNMSLKELVIVLERRFNVDIEVKKDFILNYHYDGVIKDESIIEILEIIKKTVPINYKIVGQKIEITTK